MQEKASILWWRIVTEFGENLYRGSQPCKECSEQVQRGFRPF